MGTDQNVKIYRRHGMGEDIFGVSFANLHLLQKQIKQDQVLAQQLWDSRNGDARYLAALIAEPERMTKADFQKWVRDLGSYGMCDLFASVVGRSAFARELAEKWTTSANEWVGRAGWDVVGVLAMQDLSLPDSYFLYNLEQIGRSIHNAKNFTRHAMNNTLIAIGLRNATLKQAAQAAAKRIGKVHVDHGETGCKTPDAYGYIEKGFERAQARIARLAGARR
jgi:3-methyladenine DNA glycosylase AlkD